MKVEAQNYISYIRSLGSSLVKIKRVHNWAENSRQLDVFGKFWLIFFIDVVEGALSVSRKGELTSYLGNQCFFIPPHSIVDWHLAGGVMNWTGYISDVEIPVNVPKDPVVFPCVAPPRDLSITEIFDLVRGAKKSTMIGKLEEESALAKKIKGNIDQNFCSSKPIHQATSLQNTSPSVLSRYFKRSYGLTPTQYRKKMRVFDSVGRILTESQTIRGIAFSLGYNDLSCFNVQFREELGVTPSQFLESYANRKFDGAHDG